MADDRCDLLCLDAARGEGIRASLPQLSALEAPAARAAALADPTRLLVALALREGGELCVCDLAWVVGRSDGLVSHHVRKLRAAELVRSRREGKMVFYELTPAGASALAATMAETTA
jgi:DNA-binding transcriptional ArsR family regulator